MPKRLNGETFSILSTFYEYFSKNLSVIDSFIPLILEILPVGEHFSIPGLESGIWILFAVGIRFARSALKGIHCLDLQCKNFNSKCPFYLDQKMDSDSAVTSQP